MISATPPTLGAIAALAERSTGETTDLLRISLVVALVVASVVILACAMRPLMPPARPPLTDAEVDAETLRSLGLSGDPEPPGPVVPSRRADVIPFPRGALGPRDAILDENERLYRDPIVAARLRAVLEPSRRRMGRAASASTRSAGAGANPADSAPALRSWWAAEHDRRRVRHTGGEQAAGTAPVGAGLGQESPPMPPSDMEPSSGDLPVGSTDGDGSRIAGHTGASGAGRPPKVMEGSPPSSADLDQVAASAPQPRSKVVPFIPRQAPREQPSDEAVVAPSVVAALTATVRELLFCANVGEYLHGFALYSDRHLFRFMDETGLTVDEFRAAFEGAEPRAADDWTRLSHLGEVRRLEDGRVTALVTYLDGERPGGSERYTFEFGAARVLWLIDDIAQV